MNNLKHNDCFNFENVDVAKGLCLLSNSLVPFDGNSCPRYQTKPKCKFCAKFNEPNPENIGICIGLKDSSYWTSGERLAIACEGYTAK